MPLLQIVREFGIKNSAYYGVEAQISICYTGKIRHNDTMRGIYNADFTVDVLPQAALRLHAVNYTQPL